MFKIGMTAYQKNMHTVDVDCKNLQSILDAVLPCRVFASKLPGMHTVS